MSHSISVAEWLDYAAGTLDATAAARIGRHLASCPECADLSRALRDWDREIRMEAEILRFSVALTDTEIDRMLRRTIERLRDGESSISKTRRLT